MVNRPPTGLTAFAENVWLDLAPVRILGLQLTATMTVLRLDDGSLLLHSPLAMTTERRSAIEALGPVAHLYSPNVYHHFWIGEWAAAFPSGRVHAAAGLARTRPDLRIDRVHNAAMDPSLAGVVDELRIDGFFLEESVLVYRPARTLVVADLLHNIGRPQHRWPQLYTRAMGFYDRVAVSRMIRCGRLSRSGRRQPQPRRGAGAPIRTDHRRPRLSSRRRGREALAAAYAWLQRSGR